MASITYEFYDAASGFRATCTITEIENGDLRFEIVVDESTGTVADLRGLFFDLNRDDTAFLKSLRATGTDVTDQAFVQDGVTDLGQGCNVNGDAVNQTGKFDAGVEIGSSGLKGGNDDIRHTTFVLSSSMCDLTLDMVRGVDTALRATSVGDADGARNGSLKLVGDAYTGVISGFYFLDNNGNDLDDAGDAGVSGKWVTLYNADGTRALDADGVLVAAVQTGDNGGYFFDNLAAADYIVHFESHAGHQFVARDAISPDPDVESDKVDSDVDPQTGFTGLVTVRAGYETTDVDAGVKVPPAPPPPPSSISGRYFEDANRNDIDDGEAGISGKTVTLLDADGNVVATTTASDGSYFFENVAAGIYSVRFEATEGMIFSTADVGDDDSIDSDVDANGLMGPITVEAGVDVVDIDAGVKAPPAWIAGRYFDDANGDGVDAGIGGGEAGVAGRTVTLFDAAGVAMATAVTAGDGSYVFSGLAAGTYSVGFEPVEGKVFSPMDAGNDDTVDSDVDVTTGRTGAVTVVAGQHLDDVDAGVMAEPSGTPEPWDLTGTIRLATHSLTVILDASYSTFDWFLGTPPVDINGDGINNVVDSMLAELIKRAQGLDGNQRIDVILAGADGVAGQKAVYAGDLHGLDPHDYSAETALQWIFSPAFYQPAGLPADVDFASALTAAGNTLQAAYGATGALVDEVILMTTSDGIDERTYLPAFSGYGEAAQALTATFGASIDVVLIDSYSYDWSVLTAIDSDGVIDTYSSMDEDPWNPTPDPYHLSKLVSDSPEVTEGDILGLLIGGEHFAFTDLSPVEGQIDLALSALEADPTQGIGVEIDSDGDGVADRTVTAVLEFVDGAYHFELNPADLI